MSDEQAEEQNRAIGERIKKRLKPIGMSAKTLAARVNVDERHLNRVLNGKRPGSSELLVRIAALLGCDVHQLTGESNPLPAWTYGKNPKPVRLKGTVLNDVYLLLGNHIEPLEIEPRYMHRFPKYPLDIEQVSPRLVAIAEKRIPYWNGPAARLVAANEGGNYQALDGREIKRVILDLAALSWEQHSVLNGFLDDETVFPHAKTIRARYGEPENVYRYAPSLEWSQLSNIFTVLMIPMTADGYGIIQQRSSAGVGFAQGLFISGVSENIHRYADEAADGNVARRLNSLRGDVFKKVDHLYPNKGIPSPLLAAMRGVSEEVSEALGAALEHTPHRFVFLNIIFGFAYFHPFIVGVVDLPFSRDETQRLIEESPGKDHSENKALHFYKLDPDDPDTDALVADRARWFSPGLSAFITGISYCQARRKQF